MKINVYINGQLINDPNNLQELGIEVNYDKDNPQARIGINNWELGLADRFNPADGARLSNAHLDEGLTGGVGVFEGLPFRVDVVKDGVTETVFDGYLDLSKATFECDLVTAEAVEEGGVDWLNSGVADSFTYEYLYSEGVFTDSDFTLVPYVISTLPQTRDAVLMLVSVFVIVSEVKDQIQSLVEFISGLVNPFSFDNIIKIVLRVAYIAALLITLMNLIVDLFRMIIQPVKFHAGMNYTRLCEIGCQHLGLEFESPILEQEDESKFIWLPEKFQQPAENDGLLGFLTTNSAPHKGFFKGTFGDFLRILKTMFNAKILVNDGVLKLVRRDYNDSVELYQVPPIERNGYTLNANEFYSNHSLDFLVDFNDKNTVQEYLGTAIQVQTLPLVITNEKMVLHKGLSQVSFGCALGKRKTELTVPERLLEGLFEVLDTLVNILSTTVNAVISVVNAIVDVINGIFNALDFLGIVDDAPEIPNIEPVQFAAPSDLLTDRINLMKMENDFISVPKTVMVEGHADPRNNQLLPNNEAVLSAEYLWNNYHFIDSFDSEEYEQHNQHKIYNVADVPFCFEDYLLVKNNNKILDYDNKQAELISLNWNLFEQTANMEFRVNEVYTKNLKTINLIPDGR